MAKKSIILDPVDPKDFNELKLIYACEDCSHFDSRGKACTFGFNAANHLKAKQDETFLLTGKMAFCRFLEID